MRTRAEMDARRDLLQHRGPDACGAYEKSGLYLGFRRLAIQDLTSEGSQPMLSPDGRYVIVFNGEIYNFHELRAELESAGEIFRGRSDTEVLLRLYMRKGVGAFCVANGMFAVAIFDMRERTLLLARDRLGVKPLFYCLRDGCFAFASEVRALRGLFSQTVTADTKALACYFALGWVPESMSIYPGVQKLPPGHWMRISLDGMTTSGPNPYWRLPASEIEEGRTEEYWENQIEELLADATRIRLRADVPVGVFLSGGIDSGLVAAAAHAQRTDIAALTVAFPGASNDELPDATATARHLGVRQIVTKLSLDHVGERIPGIVGHFDEPFADPSAIPSLLVCEEARKQFTVVLSGDGGDEAFAGYDNHLQGWKWRHFGSLPCMVKNLMAVSCCTFSAGDSRIWRLGRRLSPQAGIFGLGGKPFPFSDWRNKVLHPEFVASPSDVLAPYAAIADECRSTDLLDHAQRTDLRVYMLEDILPKVDRMSMRCSLEVRSPFLDYRMIELGLRIPSRLRVEGGRNKNLLRRIARKRLPQEVADAPKRGFGVPLHQWLFASEQSGVFRNRLIEPVVGYPNPFVAGGAEKLWERAAADSRMAPYVYWMLAYRWWCAHL